MTGHEVTVEWRGVPVRAWLPDRLSERPMDLSERTVRATERAAAAARRVGERIPTGFEPLARLLLRAEGLASSQVEGVDAPLEEVVRATTVAGAGDAAHVADNLDVVAAALHHARSGDALAVQDLHTWHARLMVHGLSLPEELVGSFRPGVGWIGGASPTAAVFVAAPPEHIGVLVADLLVVANECPWDPVTTAAVVHAQFETIHPYGDGNGRVGRVLSLWVLARHLEGVSVPPPMSVLIARDADAYLAALGAFRIGMDDALVDWFSSTMLAAADASLAWAARLDALIATWHARISDLRAGAAARPLLGVLAVHPVLTAQIAAGELGVSVTAARNALATLAERDIVVDRGTVASGPGRPQRWWTATELIDVVATWTP